MSTYQPFPFSMIVDRCTGTGISLIETTLPTDTVGGYADYTGQTLYLAAPTGYTSNSGSFAYVIADRYGRRSSAQVNVVYPAVSVTPTPTPTPDPAPTPTPTPPSSQIGNAYAISGGGDGFFGADLVTDIPTVNGWQPGLSAYLAIMRQGTPTGSVDSGWTGSGTSAISVTSGAGTMTIYRRFFDSAALTALASTSNPKIPMYIGGGTSAPAGSAYDLNGQGCFWGQTTDIITDIRLVPIAAGQTSVSLPVIPAGHFALSTIYLYTEKTYDTANPMSLKTASGFTVQGYGSTCRFTDQVYATDTTAPDPMGGSTFAGQDFGFALTVLYRIP